MFAVVRGGKLHAFHLLLFPSHAGGISPTRCYSTKPRNVTTEWKLCENRLNDLWINLKWDKCVKHTLPKAQQILKFNAVAPVMAVSWEAQPWGEFSKAPVPCTQLLPAPGLELGVERVNSCAHTLCKSTNHCFTAARLSLTFRCCTSENGTLLCSCKKLE